MTHHAAPTFVDCQFLMEHLNDPHMVILDCRWKLTDPQYGQTVYDRSHIPTAFFMDMNRDLSGTHQQFGGRHPLPTAQQFEETMAKTGVSPDVHVVCYDDDGSGAARCWWLLRFYGHDNVSVLQGGYPEWIEEGHPVTTDLPDPRQGQFTARPQLNLLVDFQAVYAALHRYPLVDARAKERYQGDVEPVDRIPGHIPGAVNVPFDSLLDRPAHYRDPESLRTVFNQAIPVDHVPVIYCGSGVSACINILALSSVGRDAVLYAGSWSDWIEHDKAPIA